VSAPLQAEKYCSENLAKKEKEQVKHSVYFADFESFTKDQEGNNI
jgi:hypothetical protein